jgi:hypothetical protein
MTATQHEPYTLARENGAWVIRHNGLAVRACHSERIARLYVAEWNRNKQPTPGALASALNADWRDAK